MNTSISTFSFAAGILSPELAGDIELNKNGLGMLVGDNLYVTSSGTLAKRPGSKYVAEAKGPCRLIEFVFSRTQGYALELGENYIRFCRDGSQLVRTSATAWTTSTGYVAGDYVDEGSTIYYCLEAHTSGTFATDLAADKWVAQTAVEIISPYSFSEVGEIRFTQSADVLFLTHPNHPPKKLIRVTDISWTLTDMIFVPDVEQVLNLAASHTGSISVSFDWFYTVTCVNNDGSEGQPVTAVTHTADIDLSQTPITVTWDPPADVSDVKEYKLYRKEGIYFQLISILAEDGSIGYSKTDAGLEADSTSSPPELFTDFTGTDNYPTACGFYQQRLVLGGTINKPNTIWMSRIADFENFTTTPAKATNESLDLQLDSGQVNGIKHFVTTSDLITFTDGDIWRIKDQPNIDMFGFVESTIGASSVNPIKTRKSLLFLEASQNTVSDFIYQDSVAGFDGDDLGAYSKNLFDGFQITDFTFTDSPEGRLFAVRDDGKILCLTYLKSQKIAAWTVLETDGLYESVCSVPKAKNDEVYVVVNRDSTRYIEIIQPQLLANQDIMNAWYVDNGAEYDGSQTMSLTISGTTATAASAIFVSTNVDDKIVVGGVEYLITAYTSDTVVEVEANGDITTTDWILTADKLSGLTWLANQNVSILADGDAYRDLIVDSSGEIELPDTYKNVIIGLKYTSLLQTLPPNLISSNFGSSLSRTKKLNKLFISVLRTRGIEFKTSMEGDEYQELPEQDNLDLGSEVELSSSIARIDLMSTVDLSQTVFIKNDYPLPFSILNATIEVSIEGVG